MTGNDHRKTVGDYVTLVRGTTYRPPERLQEFAAVAEPMFAKVSANAMQSRLLAELRDTLLPKLISGEIRVAGAEGVG